MKLLFAVLLSFTVIAGAQQIVRSFDAPEVGITGLAYHDNSLYALGSTSKTVFELDEISGSVTNSWGFFTASGETPTGLGYAGDLLYIAADNGTGTAGHLYEYSVSGTIAGIVDVFC